MTTDLANRDETAISGTRVGSVPATRIAADPPTPVRGARSASSAGKFARTDALVEWLCGIAADEPFPDRIHARGIFDGSHLGTPAENGAFAQHLYKPAATDADNLYCTPLNAALAKMAAGNGLHPAMPESAQNIWAIVRMDCDWRTLARVNQWPLELYARALADALDELRRIFDVRHR
jgi:hypothetical protein